MSGRGSKGATTKIDACVNEQVNEIEVKNKYEELNEDIDEENEEVEIWEVETEDVNKLVEVTVDSGAGRNV